MGLIRKNINKNEKFENLSPKTDIELNAYSEVLAHAFNDDNLKNIAITGNYGSGKTSIVETYLNNESLKAIRITVADFELNKEKDKVSKKNLEEKIINQLIHQIHPRYIRKGSFKVISSTSWYKNLFFQFFSYCFFMFINNSSKSRQLE